MNKRRHETRRYCGSLLILIGYDDVKGCYFGSVITSNGKVWRFDDLRNPRAYQGAVDSKEAFDMAAEAAVVFGSYYTSNNRPMYDEGLEGYPTAEIADEISEQAEYSDCDVVIRRSK